MRKKPSLGFLWFDDKRYSCKAVAQRLSNISSEYDSHFQAVSGYMTVHIIISTEVCCIHQSELIKGSAKRLTCNFTHA
jgi:hypothetical protein